MKKIITGLMAFLLITVPVFALDLEITGEIKTGFFYQQSEMAGETSSFARIHINDEMDYNTQDPIMKNEGRIRLGINLAGEDFGIRTLFFQNNFSRGTRANDPIVQNISVDYAYAYGHLLNKQFTVSAGFLGESPWGTGGPELFMELERNPGYVPLAGIRVEWKPNFVSLLDGLNLGFVLNMGDDSASEDIVKGFTDSLSESILGIAWEHEYFAFRFAYRLDQGYDSEAAVAHGGRFTYRVEERILGKLLPGFQISANGHAYGLGLSETSGMRGATSYYDNWLYVSYNPDFCDAGFNIRWYDKFMTTHDVQYLEFRPYFYWKFFNNLFSAGMMGGFQMGFNNGRDYRAYDDYPINYWFLEPQVKFNFANDSFIAAVYRYQVAGKEEYPDQKIINWFNLRFCYSF